MRINRLPQNQWYKFITRTIAQEFIISLRLVLGLVRLTFACVRQRESYTTHRTRQTNKSL